MPSPQDRCEVNLELVTVAGTEYTMQANLSHYEDVAELEDDILCFLPTVSDLEVFGCELELLDLREQQPLLEAFRTVLLQRPQLQIAVRPCMVEGHSIWQFQASSASSACVSTISTGTGRASRGDRSADPVSSEAESSSAGRSAVGFLAVARSLHTGTSMRIRSCSREQNAKACPKDGSRALPEQALSVCGVSIISNVFGVHSHQDQRVVFSTFFFWPTSRAPLHLRWLEALLLHGCDQVRQDLDW